MNQEGGVVRPGEVGRLGGAAPEAVSEDLKPAGPSPR